MSARVTGVEEFVLDVCSYISLMTHTAKCLKPKKRYYGPISHLILSVQLVYSTRPSFHFPCELLQVYHDSLRQAVLPSTAQGWLLRILDRQGRGGVLHPVCERRRRRLL